MPLDAGDATAVQITDGSIQTSYTLNSPDGSVVVDIELNEGSLSYSVSFDGQTLINQSNLGIRLNDGALDGNLAITGSQTTSYDQTWEPVWGGFSEVRNHYNQLEIGLETTDSPTRYLTLEFRAFDDGVGFRYVFPEQKHLENFTITSENTGFEFAGDYESWWIPNDWDNYEYYYFNTPISEVHAGDQRNHDKTSDPLDVNQAAADKDGVNTPLTMKAADDCYLSVHEAALTDYAGMTLTQVNDGTTSFESSLVPRPSGDKVRATAPHASPWRTVQVGRSAGDLVESRLLLNLNDPCKIDDTSWIEPQKYCGVWWELHIGKSKWPNGEDDGAPIGATTENVKRYMDFASEHGIGTVVAEGWNKSYDLNMIYTDSGDHFDHREAWDHGLSLDPPVNFMAHNETVGFVDRYERQMDDAYAWYGDEPSVNSIKSGYVGEDNVKLHDEVHHHHDQEMVKHYRRVIKNAAKNELMLNAHEPIKPTGVRRTYPNFMTREGVAGLEYQNFTIDGIPESHTVTTPFTRMLAGPIDHCPGIFDVFYDEYDGGLQAGPDCRVHTTRARQLAHYPMILSGLQMVADLVEYYVDGDDVSDVPPEFQYIADVPVDWDETRVPVAEIGSYTAIARRSGDEWWVGAATDEDSRLIEVPLKFLNDAPGKRKGHEKHHGNGHGHSNSRGKGHAKGKYVATVYSDAAGASLKNNPTAVRIDEFVVSRGNTLAVSMTGGGGQAIRLEPATTDQINSLPEYSAPEQTYTEVSISNTVMIGDEFVSVSGENEGTVIGGEAFEVRVNGEKYAEDLVRIPPGSGSTTLSISIDEPGTYEVSVGPVDADSLATEEVTVETDLPLGEQIAKWTDPAGDDYGPGSYTYPQHGWFNEDAFDIDTFEIWETEDRYQFLFTIHGDLQNPRGFSGDFSMQVPELYLRDPTADGAPESMEARPGVNATFEQPYHYRFVNIEGSVDELEANGIPPRLESGDGTTITDDVTLHASSILDGIMFDVPKDAIGDVSNMEVTPLMLSQDDSVETRIREVVSTETWESGWQHDWRFGGGRNDNMNPNVIDMVTPEGVSQEDALSYSDTEQAQLPSISVDNSIIDG
ncbi:glycoside hydrolase family 97 catalytic domain-containing protein [Halomontanus rarus]|uniref:glycoside hydrolase family 97 catalytic domain-containing protein n=1 Tax=Halomontanus rarus TaxID=3034020 RepID=UPI00293BA689|nr:glycoside hydrolase family 97 catalytic domain-containing protein [Halovivax sp. KZCA124]